MAHLDEHFQAFWNKYPKRVKRIAAMDAFKWAFQHHNEDGKLLTRMLATLEWQRIFYREAQFMPDPNRWLIDCRWMDENPADVARELAEAARAAERETAKLATMAREAAYDAWNARKQA